jgi:hypothetical protein
MNLFQIGIILYFEVASCLATNREHVIHERREQTLATWSKRSRAHPNAIVPVRIGLSQSNLEDAEDLLMEV